MSENDKTKDQEPKKPDLSKQTRHGSGVVPEKKFEGSKVEKRGTAK